MEFFAAFAAGLVAFLSPCVLPLLPTYLAFLGVNQHQSRLKLAYNMMFFVLGFSLIFTLLGASATALGQLLFRYQVLLGRLAGAILFIFGLQMLGAFQLPMLQRRFGFKFEPNRTKSGYFVFGVVLALGWTPCIGMMLASILMLAGNLSTVAQGMLLLFVFSLGFATPFTVIGLLVGPAAMARLSRSAARWVHRIAGAVLLIMGLLLFFDLWRYLQGIFI